jgi:hypothetical protein
MRLQYPLHLLDWQEFEALSNDICQNILGMGAFRFADGKDGGRDGLFSGTANKYPSEKSPWSGNFLIQSKHTRSEIASCSDNEFETTIAKEIIKLKSLIISDKINCYLVFTNRKGTGNKVPELVKKIKTESALQNVQILSTESIHPYLNAPIIAKYYLKDLSDPLNFYDQDIKEVITGFVDAASGIQAQSPSTFHYIDKAEKNRLNNLSEDYFKEIKRKSLSYFDKIDHFLKDTQNQEHLDRYEATVQELNSKIIEKRTHFAEFEQILNHLYDHLISKSDELRKPKYRKLVMTFLHYMYFNCDLGKSDD